MGAKIAHRGQDVKNRNGGVSGAPGLSETAAARASGYIGDTYNTAQWRNGATPAYPKGYPLDESAPVYTNHAGRLWWFADLEPLASFDDGAVFRVRVQPPP